MSDPALIWGLSLLAVAILLLVVEVFIPSGGLIAVTATVVAIVGLVFLFRYDATWGLLGVIAVMIGGPSVMLWGLKIWPDTPVGRAMMHGERSAEEDEADRQKDADEIASRRALIGLHGTADGPIRPTGLVRVQGDRYDAITDGDFIEDGQEVRVVDVSLRELKVRPVV